MTMVESTRPMDTIQEAKVIAFLDKYLYVKVFDNYELVHDDIRQKQGIDILVNEDGKEVRHDIKAQASPSYINNPTPTFCMELLFDKKNDDETVHTYNGWFVRDGLLTDFYGLCWIHKARKNASGYFDSPEDIEELEIYFVDKHKLKEYINESIRDAELLRTAHDMRRCLDKRRFCDEKNRWHYTYSMNLPEKSVNLIVKKWVLKEFSPKRYIVRKDGLWELAKDNQKILIT